MEQKNKKPHYEGHRKRLKDKFLVNPASALDYELIEMLLFGVFPRKDTKELAKNLVGKFKTLRELIFADKSVVQNVQGVGRATSNMFMIVSEIIARVLKEKIADNDLMISNFHVIEYYRNVIGMLQKEQFRAIFLNNKNRLISEEIMQIGTVNQAAIYPRELLQKALNCGASGMILVHNHPSGDPRPSHQDIAITRQLKDISQKLDIKLLDHLVIGKNDSFSFLEHGIL